MKKAAKPSKSKVPLREPAREAPPFDGRNEPMTAFQDLYIRMQDSLNAARTKSFKDGTDDHDKNGETKDLQALVRAANQRIGQLNPEAAPQDQDKGARDL